MIPTILIAILHKGEVGVVGGGVQLPLPLYTSKFGKPLLKVKGDDAGTTMLWQSVTRRQLLR